jgi:hypothetical protein
MNLIELKKATSDLLQDTGRLVNVSTDNRAVLLLVRTQVLLTLLIDEVERGTRTKDT